MRILCNLPLECFDDRSSFDGIELLTFGPGAPRWIDGSWYPFDVVFDPSTEGLGTLLSRLPPGFAPDLLLFYWPDQEPLPADLEAAPCPVVGVLSDYNLSLPYVTGLWTCFDTLLVDRAGVDLFRRLSFHDTRYFCQFTFKRGSHRVFPEVERDLDLAFAGNLNPAVQRERSAWLPRLLDLQRHGLRVEVRNQVFGADYGRFLNRARIGFNRSIRGEMNLRAFEVPACGAALLMEASNLEVREFLVPGEEVVLYGDDDFEDVACALTADRARCAEIAAAGHARVQEYRMGRRLAALVELLKRSGPARAVATPAERALGRGTAMLPTWGCGEPAVRVLTEAWRLAPDDPRPANALALALLQQDVAEHGERAVRLLQRAAALDSSYVPAAFNLASLLRGGDHPRAAWIADETRRRLDNLPGMHALDGPMLPFGFPAAAVDQAAALAGAVRESRTEVLAAVLREQLDAAEPVAR